jgi:hypothetical protein
MRQPGCRTLRQHQKGRNLRKRNRTSFDAEAASKAARARWDRVRAQAEAERDSSGRSHGAHPGGELDPDNGDLDLANLPRETLVELLKDKKTAGYVRVRAAEALARLQPNDEASEEWRRSIQVRSDYEQPTWDDVLAVAREAGAIVADDERSG